MTKARAAKSASASQTKTPKVLPVARAADDGTTPLELLFSWTPNKRIVLMSVTVSSPATAPARQVLDEIASDTDGDLTVRLGSHPPGDITIGFDFRALEAIPKVASFISRGGGAAEKFEPKGSETKKLKRGEAWIVNGRKFKV